MTPRKRSHTKLLPKRRGRRMGRVVAIAVGILAIVAGVSILLALSPHVPDEASVDIAADGGAALAASAVGTAGQTIEVPDVTNVSVEEAGIILSSVGLDVRVGGDVSPSDSVRSHVPAAGSLVEPDSPVTLVAERTPAKPPSGPSGWVVVIDPGHQRRSDMTPESIGPGAKETKPRVTGGASGVASGLDEYELALQISTNLKRRLERAGIKVVMTRTTNDVNISNSERAELANKAGADLFVRIHCDGNPDSEISGISTLYPAPDGWTKSIAGASKSAARFIQREAVLETGAVDRGIVSRGDLAGFNYSKVPAVLVECGFMSHPIEDRLLASPHYQDKLAAGIREGIVTYLAGD